MSEIWKGIPSWPLYEASNQGNIRRAARGRYYRTIGKVKIQSCNSTGYKRVSFDSKHELVHRLVCEAFHGSAPTTKYHAAHRDGNRKNNCEGNLRWLTKIENEAEKILHGRDNGGQRNGMSRTSREKRGEYVSIQARN